MTKYVGLFADVIQSGPTPEGVGPLWGKKRNSSGKEKGGKEKKFFMERSSKNICSRSCNCLSFDVFLDLGYPGKGLNQTVQRDHTGGSP